MRIRIAVVDLDALAELQCPAAVVAAYAGQDPCGDGAADMVSGTEVLAAHDTWAATTQSVVDESGDAVTALWAAWAERVTARIPREEGVEWPIQTKLLMGLLIQLFAELNRESRREALHNLQQLTPADISPTR